MLGIHFRPLRYALVVRTSGGLTDLVEKRNCGLRFSTRLSPVGVDSKNWRGPPPISYEVIVNPSAPATTGTGLEVYARLDENEYPKIEVTNTELAAVNRTVTRSTMNGTTASEPSRN